MRKLTLIIPAKSESESLPIVLEELNKKKFNFIIVMEKSDIETINSVKKFRKNIIFQKNKGYGNALIKGINSVKTELFCIFNADGSFKSSEIKKMINTLFQKNSDFVFGTRYEKNCKSDDDTFITKLGNYFFTKFGNFFYNVKITDILYTFVLGRTKKIKKLNLKQGDFSFCVELPLKAAKFGMKLSTNQSHERRRIAGQKKVNAFKDGYTILKYMIKFFLNE